MIIGGDFYKGRNMRIDLSVWIELVPDCGPEIWESVLQVQGLLIGYSIKVDLVCKENCL